MYYANIYILINTNMTKETLPASQELDPSLERGIAVSEAMRSRDISFDYTVLDDGPYEGIYVLNHTKENLSDKPTIRLYRGVNDLNSSLLDQVPYAAKAVHEDGGIKMVSDEEHAAKIQLFIDEPAYANLRLYVEPILKSATGYTAVTIGKRMRRLENSILEGETLDEALRAAHISSLVGRGEADISPYISTADTAEEAQRFGGGAILVLDVLASQVHGDGEQGEVLVGGRLPVSAISAIVVKRGPNIRYGIEAIASILPQIPSSNVAYTNSGRDIDHDKTSEEDVRAVSAVRAEALLNTIPEKIRDSMSGLTNDTTSYSRLQRDLFDCFMSEVPELQGEKYEGQLNDQDFRFDFRVDVLDRRPEPYDRDKVTDGMLAEMQREYLYDVRTKERRAQRLGQSLFKKAMAETSG